MLSSEYLQLKLLMQFLLKLLKLFGIQKSCVTSTTYKLLGKGSLRLGVFFPSPSDAKIIVEPADNHAMILVGNLPASEKYLKFVFFSYPRGDFPFCWLSCVRDILTHQHKSKSNSTLCASQVSYLYQKSISLGFILLYIHML